MSYTKVRQQAEAAAKAAKAGQTNDAIALLAEAIAILAKDLDNTESKLLNETSSIKRLMR